MLKFGADPEAKIPGVDANLIVGTSTRSAFGVDGYPRQFELRPAPAPSARGLVANIAMTLREAWEKVPFFREMKHPLLAGHFKDKRPLGGHIHVSGIGQAPESVAYHVMLKPMVMLSDAIDDLEERRLREAGNFGRNSIYRPKRGRPSNWLEFRMPGSWLLNPATAFANLWLFEAVIRKTEENHTHALEINEIVDEAVNPFDGLMELVEFVGDASGLDDTRRAMRVFDKLLATAPIDWSEDVWRGWMGAEGWR